MIFLFIGCPAGFTGRFCEVNIDDCVAGPCQHSSQCIDLVDNYQCVCGKRYYGKNCENYLGSPCNNTICKNGICHITNNGNDFVCICASDFTGKYCENSFQPCMLSPCQNNGTCENDDAAPNRYICQCDKGNY